MRIWPFFSDDELRPCAQQAGPMPERVASLICGPASLPWGWRRSAGSPSRLQGAAGERAGLRHRRAIVCRLVEVPVSQDPQIIRHYLQKVPGARPHVAQGARRSLPAGTVAPLDRTAT